MGSTVQFRAWEVEETTMDLHTGETSYRSDASATEAVPGSRGSDQGRLFDDPKGNSFDDTDQLPALRREVRRADPYGPPRWLRFAVIAVVVSILAAGAALALVKTGVIGKSNPPSAGTHTSSTTHHTSATTHTNALLTPTQTFGGAGSGNYTIPARVFFVTVTAGAGRSWVSIGVVGQKPVYAGILQPNTKQSELLLGAAQISIGAGGTTLTVTSGHKSQTLTPPSAPFTYQITPAS
jgi:hypothetical protein